MSLYGSGGDGLAEPSPEKVRQQLRKILRSRDFRSHPRRSTFLQYVVEETLADRAEAIKGFSIAVAVFDRDETFDQQTDPVVRLEARRLRQDLDSYYATDGRNDPVRISIPKGSYVPRFERQEDPDPEDAPNATQSSLNGRRGPARHLRLWLGAGFAGFLLVAAVAWMTLGLIRDRPTPPGQDDRLLAMPEGPSIAVLPFLNLSGDSKKQYLSDGITEQLATELARFRDLWVLPLGTMQLYKDGFADPRQLHRDFGVGYVLEGSVRANGEDIRITGRLIDAENARYIWVKSFDQPFTPANVYEVQDAIAEDVAGNLAGKYGVLAQDSMVLSKRKAPDSLDAYDCVLHYYDYQITINPERHQEVRNCLERAVAIEPDYAEAWAVLANVYMQEKRFGVGPGGANDDAVRQAKAAIRRALNLDSVEPTAHIVQSNLLFTEGDLEGFREAGETALRLNPNDSDLLAHFGLRLGLIGDWDRGLALVDKAIALNPVHPHWYSFPQVIFHFEREEYELALSQLDKIKMPQFFWTYLLRAATLGQLGRLEEATTAADDLLALKPAFRQEALRLMQIWQFPEPLLQSILEGLGKAGVEISTARS